MKPLPANPWATLKDFSGCCVSLWKDKLGQISLAVTTLFWGAGATLQFIVIAWADSALGYNLSQASILQGVVAAGIAAPIAPRDLARSRVVYPPAGPWPRRWRIFVRDV
jgi:hypothetical protein